MEHWSARGTAELGHELSWTLGGSAGSTLGPVPCLLLLSTADVGFVHKVMVQVNLPPPLPLVVVHLQENSAKALVPSSMKRRHSTAGR